MINYSYPLYRPPAEANNIILQVTHGCSYNHCSFCSMYKSKKFEIKALEEVYQEIDTLAQSYPQAKKVFLADGDALCLETSHLLEILKYLKKSFTKLSRVSVYATAQNLLEKSDSELALLKDNLLNLIYFGIETGNEVLLKKITKGVNAQQIIRSLQKATKAGMKTSTTVILGIGGVAYTKEHIKDTAVLINQTEVTYLSTLQLGLDEDAKRGFFKHFDDFNMLTDTQVLDEQRRFLELLEPKNKVIFRSNHASNALHLAGTFPKDKQRLINEVRQALEIGEAALVPEMFRGF
ncbi:MAG TPA: radical SAM protein [Sulfurimonas sp.]|nr:radical SAM protein [Sulfurimonas sp.]